MVAGTTTGELNMVEIARLRTRYMGDAVIPDVYWATLTPS
jgi:hypothetical protein